MTVEQAVEMLASGKRAFEIDVVARRTFIIVAQSENAALDMAEQAFDDDPGETLIGDSDTYLPRADGSFGRPGRWDNRSEVYAGDGDDLELSVLEQAIVLHRAQVAREKALAESQLPLPLDKDGEP